MYALAQIGEGIGEEVSRGSAVRRRERLSAVVAAEDPRCRDADVHALGLVGIQRDRVAAHAAGARVPPIASLVTDDPVHRLPAVASVVRAEENPRRGAQPEPTVLAGPPRLDVPGLLQGQAGVLGEAQLLRPRPALAAVGRAVDGRSVDVAVRRRVDRPVARVDDGVEDRPPREEGAGELPSVPALVALQEEEPLTRTDEDEDAHARHPIA